MIVMQPRRQATCVTMREIASNHFAIAFKSITLLKYKLIILIWKWIIIKKCLVYIDLNNSVYRYHQKDMVVYNLNLN